MRVAILETVKTQAGFEQEFDRLIIDELKKQGHDPVLYLPEHSSLPVNFGIPIEYLKGGEIIDYEGAGKVKKIWLSIQRERRRVRWFNSAYKKACRHEVDAIILTTATYRYLRSLHKSQLSGALCRSSLFFWVSIRRKNRNSSSRPGGVRVIPISS